MLSPELAEQHTHVLLQHCEYVCISKAARSTAVLHAPVSYCVCMNAARLGRCTCMPAWLLPVIAVLVPDQDQHSYSLPLRCCHSFGCVLNGSW